MLNFNNSTNQEVDKQVFEPVYQAAQKQLALTASIELTLINDQQIRTLNKQYADNDYATDVLSWAFQETNNLFEHELLGEVYISVETAQRQAESKQHSLKIELAYLFAHGLLHLLGYDHQTPAEKAVMDKLTEKIT